MKVKILLRLSKFFKIGSIVDMEIINRKGDFRLSSKDFSQSFSHTYHNRVAPVSFEDFATNTTTKNEIINEP